MTALTMDRKTDQMGTPDVVWPQLLNFGVESATTIYGGALVAVDSSGYAVPASASSALKCVGRCERQAVNTTAAGFGTAGEITVQVRQGVFFFNCPDSSIATANLLQVCYAVDDNNVSLSDAGGTRPYAGIIYGVNSSTQTPDGSQIAVFVGMASAYQSNPEVATSAAFRARAVITTLHAYTGTTTGILTSTANGALGTQDGVATIAAGDVVFIQAGTTNLTAASDSGPYVVTQLGVTSVSPWILSRPDWWPTGGTMPLGADITLDGEGTFWAGVTWRSFAAKGTVIDTTDPAFYPRSVTQQVQLGSGTKAITNVPIRSATKSNLYVTVATLNGTYTTTSSYGTLAAATPGYIGSSVTVSVNAIVTGQTVLTTDTSFLNVTITN